MVRSLNQITFSDEEFEMIAVSKEKHGGNWHDFILDVVRFYNQNCKEVRS